MNFIHAVGLICVVWFEICETTVEVIAKATVKAKVIGVGCLHWNRGLFINVWSWVRDNLFQLHVFQGIGHVEIRALGSLGSLLWHFVVLKSVRVFFQSS